MHSKLFSIMCDKIIHFIESLFETRKHTDSMEFIENILNFKTDIAC